MKDSVAELKQMGEPTTSYETTLDILDKLLQRLDIATTYPVDLDTYTSYEVSVPEDGTYAINLETNNWSKFYKSENLQVVIDGSKKSFVEINPNKNIQVILTTTIDASHSESTFNVPFTYFDSYSQYHLSFNYFFERDGIFEGYVTQDIDQVVDGKLNPKLVLEIPQDQYFNGWRSYSNDFTPDVVAKSAKVALYVAPYNICQQTNPGLFSVSCSFKDVSHEFDKEVTVHVRNLSVTRIFNNRIFLTKSNTPVTKTSSPKVTYDMINSALYRVTISHATSPFFLTFLQSYNPLWKAYFIENGKKIELNESHHILVNSFANAWYVDKKGSYEMLLAFYPEQFLDIGQNISLYSIVVSLIILLANTMWNKVKDKNKQKL